MKRRDSNRWSLRVAIALFVLCVLAVGVVSAQKVWTGQAFKWDLIARGIGESYLQFLISLPVVLICLVWGVILRLRQGRKREAAKRPQGQEKHGL